MLDAAAFLRNGLAQIVICGSQYFRTRASRYLKEQVRGKKKKQLKTLMRSAALGNPQGSKPLVGVSRRLRGAGVLENASFLLLTGNGTLGTNDAKCCRTLSEKALRLRAGAAPVC